MRRRPPRSTLTATLFPYTALIRSPRLNLHSVWDGLLAERAISTPPSIVRRYSAAEKARMQAGDVIDWSREAAKVAHDSVYGSVMAHPCAPTPAKVVLDEAPIERLVQVAQLKGERGGLALALKGGC